MPDPYSILSCFYYSNIFYPRKPKKAPVGLSPKVIDEGQARHSCPFAVGPQEGRPSFTRGEGLLIFTGSSCGLAGGFLLGLRPGRLGGGLPGRGLRRRGGVSLFSRRSGTGSSFQSWFSPKTSCQIWAWVPFSTRIPTRSMTLSARTLRSLSFAAARLHDLPALTRARGLGPLVDPVAVADAGHGQSP